MNATVIAHWPGQDTPACPHHLQKLVSLAAVMGFPLSWTDIEGEIECSNCANEAKKLLADAHTDGGQGPGIHSPEERDR